MWYGLRISSKVDAEFADSATELLRSRTRSLIITIGGLYLAWYLVSTVAFPFTVGWHTFVVGLVVVLTHAVSLWVLPRKLLVAQAVWQAGLVAAITLAVYSFRQPEIGFFYSLLPLMAGLTIGWPASVLAESVVIALVGWLYHSGWMPSMSISYALGIIFGGAFTGLLGWVTTDALLTVTLWSLFYSKQAREKMEEAQNQRIELQDTQQDLIHANQELARLSDRLKAMNQVAEEARRAKEEFVANVSHELRTPLNMIIGFSEMITQSPRVYGNRLPLALLADITAIQRNSQHLAKLVNDVLDLSQVEAGRMALSKEWTSIQGIIEEATHVVQALFESKGLYLETEVPPDLPPVFCDGTRIRQVVINLLSNSGRFTERGGVRVKAWCDEGNLVLSMADTGPGIAEQDQKKLFEPFQQLDGSIHLLHGGSGLGLSISKRFVEMHGGKMWLESRVGVGTTIIFSLPLETPLSLAFGSDSNVSRWFNPHSEYEYRSRTRRSKAPAPRVIPRYVLLEKGEALQRLFSRYLDGVETVLVRSIEEAITELSRSPAQALVVNIPPFEEMRVPVEQLTNLPYDTPAVTCWVPGEDEAAKRLGVVRYLIKPVTRETLLSVLGDLGQGVKSVLLVDDEPEALQLFTRMLSSAERRYDVLQAKNGHRALTLLRQRKPDVVLLDLIMPGMDGFQVLKQKSQDPAIRQIPVVVISSRDPSGQPIVSDTLTVTRSGGLSARNFLACIQALSEILSPSVQSGGPGQPEKPAA